MRVFEFLFGFSGRIGRGRYLLGLLATALVFLGSFFCMELLTRLVPKALDHGWVFMLAPLWVIAAITGKRVHDLDKSAWWVLVIGTIFPALALLKGTEGPNRFGPDPDPPVD